MTDLRLAKTARVVFVATTIALLFFAVRAFLVAGSPEIDAIRLRKAWIPIAVGYLALRLLARGSSEQRVFARVWIDAAALLCTAFILAGYLVFSFFLEVSRSGGGFIPH